MNVNQSQVNFTTPQEEFWAGEFGDAYIERNQSTSLHASRLALWAKILNRMPGLLDGKKRACLELGANIGLNLKAIADLAPGIELFGVEINEKAAEVLRRWGKAEVFHCSLLDFHPARKWDLVFTCGVLIHINPDLLTQVYDTMYKISSKYIIMSEYYNPSPVEIAYRGHTGKLFKRDFAGEIMDRYSDLRLVDYGFVYHRDRFPADDSTWFLMEKQGR